MREIPASAAKTHLARLLVTSGGLNAWRGRAGIG